MKKYLVWFYFKWILPGLIYGLLMWFWQWRNEGTSVVGAVGLTLSWVALTNALLAWRPLKRLTAGFYRTRRRETRR